MYKLLIFIVIGLVFVTLCANIYFRVTVMKAYKKLVQNDVDFKGVHFFNTKRMEEEVLPLYPQHQDDILTFVKNMRYSMKVYTILMVLITMFGGILMYYRE
ncbi:MAG: hypothetical protein ACI94Y_003809 [Maribacter sp.]|jgi:hypothetical protein